MLLFCLTLNSPASFDVSNVHGNNKIEGKTEKFGSNVSVNGGRIKIDTFNYRNIRKLWSVGKLENLTGHSIGTHRTTIARATFAYSTGVYHNITDFLEYPQ